VLAESRRNSISMLAQAHFPPARLHKLDAQEGAASQLHLGCPLD